MNILGTGSCSTTLNLCPDMKTVAGLSPLVGSEQEGQTETKSSLPAPSTRPVFAVTNSYPLRTQHEGSCCSGDAFLEP